MDWILVITFVLVIINQHILIVKDMGGSFGTH